MGNRELRRRLRTVLTAGEFPRRLGEVLLLPGRKAVNPLFSFFHDRSEAVRWHAVTAMGMVVARLAEEDPESARVVMRRLMWNLNDESGGIGWGSPEAMGEICARSEAMAREYATILLSYIDPGRNFLELPMLQRGALWAAGRLAHERPERAGEAAGLLPPFFSDADPVLRGLAAWAGRGLDDPSLAPLLEGLTGDPSPVRLYREMVFLDTTVGALAAGAAY
jgi:hypothetical protein